MRGTLLDFNYRSGKGEISGEDGQRYRFSDSEWRGLTRPKLGQILDFQPRREQAVAIYNLATPVEQPPAARGRGPVKEKSKMVAAVLALFFGALGVHKFYMGKFGAGLTMLLVTMIAGILVLPAVAMAIIALIECVKYLVITHDEFDRRYVRGDQSWF